MICGARARPKEGPNFRCGWMLLLNTCGFAHGCGGELAGRQLKVGSDLSSTGEEMRMS